MSGFLCSMVGASFTVAAAAVVVRSKKGITANGNAKISTAQSQFGGASALFDGTSDYLTVAGPGFNWGTGDFTVEAWVRHTAINDQQVYWDFRTTGTNHHIFYITSGNKLEYYDGSAYTGTTSLATNTWYHVAVSRSSGTLKIFLNGAQEISTSNAGNHSSVGPMVISSDQTFLSTNSVNGYMDEIRVSNTARYTTTFTPSTTAFVNDDNTLLLIHANGTNNSTFFDDDNGSRKQAGISAIGNAQVDTAQSKFGGASALFDGTGDYLTIPHDSTLSLTDYSNWTVECWVRLTEGTSRTILNKDGVAGSLYPGYTFYTNGSKQVNFGVGGSAGNWVTVTRSTALADNTWYHLAGVKNGSTITFYVDGVSAGTTTFVGYADQSRALLIGWEQDGTYMYGHIDEVRISNSARYTTTFTPSTTASVNDVNTVLLIHADGTDASTVFEDDNSGTPTVAPSTAVSFDGTNDFYEATGITTSATDSKYLTIAFTWFHATGDNSRNQHFMTARLGTTNGENGWEVCIQSGRFRYSSYDNTGSSTDMVYGDYAGPTENAYNQIVAYVDHTSFANCKYYLNGVDRTANLLNGAAIGAVSLGNNNINWGSSNVSIKIGEQNTTAGYNSGFDDFLGRISQIYCHNASGAPDINKFWHFGSNRPRDLGTTGTTTGLAQPLIYHYGNTTTFPTNNGTGFNAYTLTATGNIATADGPTYA